MYSIFVNDLCIFDDTSSDLTLKVISANLSLEDNSAGSLEMTLPITNIGYDQIVRMRSHVIVKRDGVKIWGGRPLSESEDFYKNKTIFCEGELAYLNDTFQPLEEYYGLTLRQFIQVILHVHNNKCNGDCNFVSYSNRPAATANTTYQNGKKVIIPKSTYDFYISYDEAEEVGSQSQTITDGSGETSIVTGDLDKRIYVGTITVNDTSNNDYRCTNFVSTMEVLGDLVERLGGHMRIRTGNDGKLYLDYLRDFPNRAVQTVQLAKNLLDYRKDYDMSNLCTVLLPLGAKKNEEDSIGDEVKTHWNRRSYLDSSGRLRYGQYFHRTHLIPIKQKTTWNEYDSSTGKVTERTTYNTLYVSCEQVAGQYYVYFYNSQKNPISGQTANSTNNNSKDKGTQVFNRQQISIPADAAYVAFGFYRGGTKNNYLLTIWVTQDGHTTTYTNDSLGRIVNGVIYGYDITQTQVGKSLVVANETIDSNGNFVHSLADDYVVSKPIRCKEKENYYITTRQDNGYGMFCVYGKDDRPLRSVDMAGTGIGYTDWEKNKVEMPAGATYFVVGGKTDVGLNPTVFASYKAKSEHYEPPDEYVTIESVNDGNLYIQNDELVSRYGWIEKQAVWDDMDTPEKLLARANEYLATTQFDDMVLEINAYDLHLVNRNQSAINILDKVQCLSTAHDLDRTLPVTKLEIPLTDPANATYTLGEESSTPALSGATASSDSELFRKLTEVPTPSQVLNSAKANATEILNMQTSSYTSVEADEILIMDAPDKDSATRLWRFNVNGIGYSSEGYAGTYGLAMTMDGSIVADRITTGYMHADRIRGGVLTLGGYDNVSGEFYMKNEDGKNFVKMTKDGADMICRIRQPIQWGDTDQPKYGLVEYNKGDILGCTATIKAKVVDDDDTEWFDRYTFSFDDLTSQKTYTRLRMMETLGSNGNTPLYGIDVSAGDGFYVYCRNFKKNGVGGTDVALSAPQFRLYRTGQEGRLFFNYQSNGWVGMRYLKPGSLDFTSEDEYNSITNGTLTIQNHGTAYNVTAGIGVGGVEIRSKFGPVSLDGRDIYIRGTYLHINKGSTSLTNVSRTFTYVKSCYLESDGRMTTKYATIKVTNGFITEINDAEPSDSGGFSGG